MEVTGEDKKYIYFKDYFQGNEIKIIKNKLTDEICFDANDVVRCAGLANSMDEFLSSDKGLDFISDCKKENPNMQIFGDNGMIRKLND